MNKYFRNMLRGAMFLLAGMMAAPSMAMPIAGIEWANNSTGSDGPWMLGYRFTTSQAIRVTNLGAYDHLGDGFALSHSLGLWNDAGTLLGTGSLASGSSGSLVGHFRYDNIANIILGAGTYIVGASNFGTSDVYAYNPTSAVMGTGITYLNDRWQSGTGFLNPINSNGGYGWWGGNFLYDTNVPEPTTLALLGLGLAGLGFRAKRKKLN